MGIDARSRAVRRASAEYGLQSPRSICTCLHTGDGVHSDHGGLIGHGACKVVGCGCVKFSWSHWLPSYERAMADAMSPKKGAV